MTIDQTPIPFDTIPTPQSAPWLSPRPASPPRAAERAATAPPPGKDEPTELLTGWPRVFPGL